MASKTPPEKRNAVWADCDRNRERRLCGKFSPLGRKPASRLSGLRQSHRPAFRLFAGRCPTPHFYERLEETI